MSKSLPFNFLRLTIVVALSVISLLRETGKKLSGTSDACPRSSEPQTAELRRRKLLSEATGDLVLGTVIEEQSVFELDG